MNAPAESAPNRREEYRCPAAARWLPRTLAASLILGAVLLTTRIPDADGALSAAAMRILVLFLGLASGFWVIRSGAEVHTRVLVDDDELVFARGSRETKLALQDIDTLLFRTPFAASRHWLPATVLIDRFGRGWRLSPLLRDGDRLIGHLVRGRSELESWAETLGITGRMGRPDRLIRVGYGAALSIVLLAVVFALTSP